MSSSLRLLTYNTKLRSVLMEVGVPPSIPPEYDAPLRAHILADRLRNHPTEIDVVCLNEVFDEPSRAVLSHELRADFPYQVTKADAFHVTIDSPGLTDDVQERIWELTFGRFADVAALAMLKAEDSGLFLASRVPFATVPPPPEVVALVGPQAFLQGVPVVRFTMYAASTDTDQHAAKGVLYVRLKPPGTGERHLFLSHAQADTVKAEEHALERGAQMEQAEAFLEHCLGESPPFTQEAFFLGDLNVIGNELRPLVPGVAVEWERLFGMAGPSLHDAMVDRWRRDQCPGGSSGRTDQGFTADVGFPPTRQRLDYFFSSATSDLAVQHVRVDHALADPQGAVGFLSDHLPVLADLNAWTPFCTPATAFEVPQAAVDWDHDDSLIDGMVRWFRFDVAGTYDVDFRFLGADTAFEIYVGDNFSDPEPTYRLMSDPERGLRFVLVAPFFIKVFLRDRHSESSFTLRTHRHEGRSWRDAIVLVPGRTEHEAFSAGPFNIASGDTDWDDTESKWFLVETPLLSLPEPLPLAVTLHGQSEELLLSLGEWDGVSPPVTLREQAGPDLDPLPITWVAPDNSHFMVLVQRPQGPGMQITFEIQLETTLSLLVTRPAVRTSLVCEKETSGWGADDIALQLRADGVLVASLPNSLIGDFEEGTVKQLGDKLPPFLAYTQGLEVRVIEEDDIDPDDVGAGTVPPVDDATMSPGFTVLRPGEDWLEGSLSIVVDDGRYGFRCLIARWHPEA